MCFLCHLDSYKREYIELIRYKGSPKRVSQISCTIPMEQVMHSTIDAIKDIARMMKAHLEKIMNYFVHRITNARAEGINSKIALIEKAYGFRNKEHLKTAIYFRCGNLQLYP